MKFGKGYWKPFAEGIEREWVITNGIGGYCGSTIINANARRHHAYLIASLHPPVERVAVLNKTDEQLKIGDKIYSFATNQKVGDWNDNGQEYLQRFIYDELPHFIYQAEGTFVTKTLSFEWGKNTIAIGYDIMNGSKEAEFFIKPFLTYRDHHSGNEGGTLNFDVSFDNESMLKAVPEANKDVTIRVYASEGAFIKNENEYENDVVLQTEINTGNGALDNSYTPYDIVVALKPYEHKKISVICSVETEFEKNAFKTIEAGAKRIRQLKKKLLNTMQIN